MTRTASIFLAIALLSTVALQLPLGVAEGGNLLANGEFNSAYVSWTQWGDHGACEHRAPRSGYVELGDNSRYASCGFYQAVPVKTGGSYTARASLYVTHNPDPDGAPQLYLRWVDAAGSDVGNFPYMTAYGTGNTSLAASGVAPSGATHVRVWIYVPTAHVADFSVDRVSLEGPDASSVSPPPPPPPPSNYPPNACFEVTPPSAKVGETFRFDATCTSDDQTASDQILVRWDWEGDGLFDSDWSTQKVAFHVYSTPRTYYAVVAVMDAHGEASTTSREVQVLSDDGIPNVPPRACFSAHVPDGSLTVYVNATCAVDPDGPIASFSWAWESDAPFEPGQMHDTHTYPDTEETTAHFITLRVVDSEGAEGYAVQRADTPGSSSGGGGDECYQPTVRDCLPVGHLSLS